MDHYEHRSWPAWHRHMIFVNLALNFLLRNTFYKNSDIDTCAGEEASDRNILAPIDHH